MPVAIQKKASRLLVLLFLSFAFIFFSCKKNIDPSDTAVIPGNVPDLGTTITSSVSGFVTDQTDAPVVNATVKAGDASTTTDQYGYFSIKNTAVIKEAATVTVTYSGYFKVVKTYLAAAGKPAFFRIKLLQKTVAGTISASAGGSVSLANGINILFPANAVKDASTGTFYTGTFNVAAQYIDPFSNEVNKIMPGDLRGIDKDGFIKGLSSYGMVAVELTGGAGQLLQIADGKKATITMPVPASAASDAPATIPLWYFNENNGLWKEDGMATKNGNSYTGDVSHFSCWNLDLPNAIVPVIFTIVNAAHLSYPGVYVNIVPITPSSSGHSGGFANDSGFVSMFVTPNTTYSLTVFGSNCNESAYSQIFSVGDDPVNLGNIIITDTFYTYHVTGTITDCNNNPVINGTLIFQNSSIYSVYNSDGSGAFSFNTILCSDSNNIHITAMGGTPVQQSISMLYTLLPGTTNIGNLQACGITIISGISNGFLYHPTSPRSIENLSKILSVISPTSVSVGLGDLGASGYEAIFDRDPITNQLTITAAPGAVGGPYTQFDNGLPATNPGYTAQWNGSAQCNNVYDPISHQYRVRYGYMGGTGYRVTEECIQLP